MLKRRFNSFFKTLRSSKRTIVLIATFVAIVVILNSLISIWLIRFHNWRLPTIGTIFAMELEVFGGDTINQTGKPQIIEWGEVYPGIVVNRSLYVRSKSTIETILNLELSNLTFFDFDGKNVTDPFQSYMTLTWNYNNTRLKHNETVFVTLSLSVSPDIEFINYLIGNNVATFSFDIRIYPSRTET